MKIINALTVRKKFGSVLDEVHDKKVHIVISRANEPLVVMIPFEEYYEKILKVDKIAKRKGAAEAIFEWRAKYGQKLRGMDVVAEIRKIREGRWSS